MPFVPNTPESLIARSDSKHPNLTCRGITASGRPCRRPLATSAASSPNGSSSLFPPSSSRRRPQTPDPRDESLYCWQHKEQASLSAHSSPGPRATATPILEEPTHRTSLDTLADRLGLVDLQDKEDARRKKNRQQKRDTRPNGGRRHQYAGSGSSTNEKYDAGKGKKKEKPSLKFCFCFTIPLEEVSEPARPARPQPRPIQQRPSTGVPSPSRTSKSHLNSSSPSTAAAAAKSSRKSTTSQTATFMKLIPEDLDATTASALLAELGRPYAESEEPGYIYMFWLRPETTASRSAAAGSAPADAARAMLAPPSASPRGGRRVSDVVSSYADTNTRSGGKKTMVLKIGRAANVQRRMNQWQRQCGRDVEVLRYYPYAPTASAASEGLAAAPPRTAPHARRVERLIHIELAGRGLRAEGGACDACGREHREWFEVDASRDAVREVDRVIRRWVEWDEGMA